MSLTGSTIEVYTFSLTGSLNYRANCPLCGHPIYGKPMFYSGSDFRVECGWCGRVFNSGSNEDVTLHFRGYHQGEFGNPVMVFSHTTRWQVWQ